MLDRQAELSQKREREAMEKRMEQERERTQSSWWRNSRGGSEREKDTMDGPRREHDSDRRKGPAALSSEEPPRSKPESWKPREFLKKLLKFFFLNL